jgi:GntR family transcriptional repressor for pyruvate dehydrogenase complex
MSVSRASLREAMAELENKHLIERTPGRGTIIIEASTEELALRGLANSAAEQDDAAELRLVVEPSIAALAAQRATESNLLQLREVLDATATSIRPARSLELDLEFHLLLAQAAGNPLLATLHGLMAEWTMPVRTHSHSTKAGRTYSAAWHRAIYDAVAARNPDAARTAMEKHLADVRTLIATETNR